MTQMLHALHQFEHQAGEAAAHFMRLHQALSLLLLSVGLPLFVLAAVYVSTSALMLPIGYMCGWL